MHELMDSDVISRLYDKINVRSEDDCWLWKAARNPDGYGKFSLQGRTIGAHRAILTLKLGRDIAEGLQACHRCGNRRCANPHHIYEGSPSQNAADRETHGTAARGERSGARKHRERMARGEQHGRAKISAARVEELRHQYATGHFTCGDLAREVDVSPSAVNRIVTGHSWQHLPMPAAGRDEGRLAQLFRERCLRGEQHPKAKLTESDVRQIRHRFATGQASLTALAREAGVTKQAIQSIVTGKTWRHVGARLEGATD